MTRKLDELPNPAYDGDLFYDRDGFLNMQKGGQWIKIAHFRTVEEASESWHNILTRYA